MRVSKHFAIALVVASAIGIAIAACSSAPDTSTAAQTTSGTILTGAGGASSTGAQSSSVTSTTANVGGAGGNGGDSSVGGSDGSGGFGGSAPVCDNSDPGEPNDTEAEAYLLGSIDCADGDGGNIYGVLSDGSDVDWFTYSGTKSLTCDVDADVSIVQGQGALRICQFFNCVSGETQVTCPDGTTSEVSQNGFAGCCGTSDFDTTDLNCKGVLENNIAVYIRVDDPTGQAMCLPYTIAYHY